MKHIDLVPWETNSANRIVDLVVDFILQLSLTGLQSWLLEQRMPLLLLSKGKKLNTTDTNSVTLYSRSFSGLSNCDGLSNIDVYDVYLNEV
jgi:hypothetical protein